MASNKPWLAVARKSAPTSRVGDIRQPVSTPQEHHGARQHSSKNKRVGEPPVSPKVTVSDAEPESDHINVRNYRAQCTYDPDSFWNAGLVEERP